jgi:lipoprotein-anchoring transpeptidase ErfK/SrfK
VYQAPWDRRVLQQIGPVSRWAGGRSQLLVLESALVQDPSHGTVPRVWLRVALPRRPNGASGWLRADDVSVHETPWRIVISTGRRTVTVLRKGHRVARFSAVVGKPSTPTPHGLFAINEIVRQPDPHGFLGPWAIHITAHSNVLFNYGGGPGRVAIHGRDGSSLLDPLGSARSHGCVRVPDRWISYLATRVEPGVPVRIER